MDITIYANEKYKEFRLMKGDVITVIFYTPELLRKSPLIADQASFKCEQVDETTLRFTIDKDNQVFTYTPHLKLFATGQ